MSLDLRSTGKHLDAMTDEELHELELMIKMKREMRRMARSTQIIHSHSDDHTKR